LYFFKVLGLTIYHSVGRGRQ